MKNLTKQEICKNTDHTQRNNDIVGLINVMDGNIEKELQDADCVKQLPYKRTLIYIG